VKNGKDGRNGRDGVDGKSPTIVTNENQDGSHTIVIINPDGTKQEIVVKNGKDGKDGRDGRDGRDSQNGQNGRDGRDGRDSQNGQNGRDGRDGQNGRDGRDSQNGQNGQNGRDGTGTTPGTVLSNNYGNGTPTPSTLGFLPSVQNTGGEMNSNRLVKELPHTGEERSISLSLLSGASILGLIGTVQMRRKRESQD